MDGLALAHDAGRSLGPERNLMINSGTHRGGRALARSAIVSRLTDLQTYGLTDFGGKTRNGTCCPFYPPITDIRRSSWHAQNTIAQASCAALLVRAVLC